MIAVLLALGAALSYGFADFIGGLVSRRTSPWQVAVVSCLASAAGTVVVAMFVSGSPAPADFAWATLGGLGSGAGVAFLYRGLSAGRMAVVAPVSGVGAALVPVLFGVIGGERPGILAWCGILVALPAIWLVSSPGGEPGDGAAGSSRSGLLDGVLAGLGFGLLFACLGQVPRASGLGPLLTAQLVSVPTVIALAAALRQAWVPRARPVWWAAAGGPFASTAILLFLLATQHGYLTVSGVLTSLYPASTVILAALVLRERVHRSQGFGIALCALTVVLVVAG